MTPTASFRMPRPSQDRCHRALLVLDIILHIFEEAMKDSESGGKTLARVSRTCTAWKEPGYDVLWRDTNLVAALQALAPMDTIPEGEMIGWPPERHQHYVSFFPAWLDWMFPPPSDFVYSSDSREFSLWPIGITLLSSPNASAPSARRTSIVATPDFISAPLSSVLCRRSDLYIGPTRCFPVSNGFTGTKGAHSIS